MNNDHISRYETTINMGWARENPELFVKSIGDFYNTYQTPTWKLKVEPTMVPIGRTQPGQRPEDRAMKVGYLELSAQRQSVIDDDDVNEAYSDGEAFSRMMSAEN